MKCSILLTAHLQEFCVTFCVNICTHFLLQVSSGTRSHDDDDATNEELPDSVKAVNLNGSESLSTRQAGQLLL